jgi:hypothetical protein
MLYLAVAVLWRVPTVYQGSRGEIPRSRYSAIVVFTLLQLATSSSVVGIMEDEGTAIQRRIKEMEEKIEANERTLAAERTAERDFFNAALISDGKKYRWEVNPEGKHVPVEEPLTEADVAAIRTCASLFSLFRVACVKAFGLPVTVDALDKEDFRLSEDIRVKTDELKRLEAELSSDS